MDDVVLSRETFEMLIRPLVQRTIDLIEELLFKTGLTADDLSNILLVGGSSCIPLVKQMLIEKYGEEKILSSEKPMLAIAHGAAILAASMDTSKWVDDADDFDVDAMPSDGPIVYTSKHNYFIQVVKDGEFELEKIIEDQTPLPFSINRQFSTTADDQKIVEVKLFSDAEDGAYDKLASGFVTISDTIPAGSKLNFTFNLDEDENLRVKVKIVATGKNPQVVLGRGGMDSSCLSEMSDSISEVLSDPDLSNPKKAIFVAKIQGMIEFIAKNKLKSDDNKWLELVQKVKSARQFTFQRSNDLGVRLATVLVNEFQQYLDPNDREAMNEKIAAYNSADDAMQRDMLDEELEKMSLQYALLLNIYMYKGKAINTHDPQISKQANHVYNEMMDALKKHDIPSIHRLQEENSYLLDDGATLDASYTGLGAGNGNEA